MSKKPFQIKKTQTTRITLPKLPKAARVMERPEDETPELRPIKGIWPDSKNELYLAMALDRMGLGYDFQVPIPGVPSGAKGAYRIDFIVYTMPTPTPIEVEGEYWHGTGTRKTESEYRREKINHIYKGQMRRILVAPGRETNTLNGAMNFLWRNL